MKYNSTRMGISRQDLAQDRAFWRDLLARRSNSRGLPVHSAGGYRNRRFAIVRNAVWITLYRARLPFPQVGVFLRCTGLAGEAFFTLADRARTDIEPRLRTELRARAEIIESVETVHRPPRVMVREGAPSMTCSADQRQVVDGGPSPAMTMRWRSVRTGAIIPWRALSPGVAMEWGTSHHPGMTDIAAILAAPLPWNNRAAEQHIAWMLRVGAAWWNCFASLAGGPEMNATSPPSGSPCAGFPQREQ